MSAKKRGIDHYDSNYEPGSDGSEIDSEDDQTNPMGSSSSATSFKQEAPPKRKGKNCKINYHHVFMYGKLCLNK